ncbi:PREDICTED: desiccation-related protein PCC13-62-like [Lupinus angustifolius]|nr:PREDICTED: desiccation-related protein PCC13-62-like [Lupinus angustifolius]
MTMIYVNSDPHKTFSNMALDISISKVSIVVLLTYFFLPSSSQHLSYFSDLRVRENPKSDVDLVEFALNLEYLEAEFFLFGATGQGLDGFVPELAEGGPSPIGGNRASLDKDTKDVILQFALQEIGHLRAIKRTVKGFPRPLLNISKEAFAQIMDSAFGEPLHPPFNPYANHINYLLASYVIPYVGLTGYVGANPELQNGTFKKLVAGLLGVESGQDAVIRAKLYHLRDLPVHPYNLTVEEITNHISRLRNELGRKGVKDEGLLAPAYEGFELKFAGKVLAGDKYSLAYSRTPKEILRIVYGGGDEHVPGGFFPKGADGRIARSYLKSAA